MEKINTLPTPPWYLESAAVRLKHLEDDFNSLNVDNISANFSEDAEVRFGTQFLSGREKIRQYIAEDQSGKQSYKLKLDLWGALKGRMAVRFELEWNDMNGKAYKSYGVQVFQFNEESLISMNYVSFNDLELR